jgi:hypothetical protein
LNGSTYTSEDLDTDDLISFKIQCDGYNNGAILGSTPTKQLDVKYLESDPPPDGATIEIEPFAGIETNGEVLWVSLGRFKNPTFTVGVDGVTSVVAYDYMDDFNETYSYVTVDSQGHEILTDGITYPISAQNYLNALLTRLGITLGGLSVNAANKNFQITGNNFTNGESCKFVLSNLVQLMGAFAVIGPDNRLYVRTLNADSKEIWETELGEGYFDDFKRNGSLTVTKVTLGLGGVDGEEISEGTNEGYNLVINDNYFLGTEAQRQAAIHDLYVKLAYVTRYLGYSGKVYGYPFVEMGTFLYDEDDDLEETDSTLGLDLDPVVINYTFEYNGVFGGSIDTPVETEKEQSIKASQTSAARTLKRVEINIDRVNGRIEEIVGEQQVIYDIATDAQETANSSVTNVEVQYALGDTTTTPPSTGWSTVAPQWQQGKYMWQRTVTTYGSGSTETSDETCISGADGQDGQPRTTTELTETVMCI